MPSTITHLQCSRDTCANVVSHASLQNLCPLCKSPLLARYDLAAAGRTLSLEGLRARANTMWRYEEVLPAATPITLGEGMTPLIHARRLGERVGLRHLYIKDEGLNPTASFKARGLVGCGDGGQSAWRADARAPDSGQRRRRGGGLCRQSRARMRHRHAVRYARRQYHRVAAPSARTCG